MKRILATAILLIYCVSVSALSLNLHFCGDYLNHISFGVDNHGKCCCANKPLKDNCCEDVKVKFSTTQTHACGDVLHTPESAKFFLIIFNTSSPLSADFIHVNDSVTERDTGPPERYGPSSIFLRNNNLRI
ncbi:MAG: hypothetical protein L6Q81_11125 [Bacteroidia bacterium]|nr:hypothetical protein [Bacteroidia bacterium]